MAADWVVADVNGRHHLPSDGGSSVRGVPILRGIGVIAVMVVVGGVATFLGAVASGAPPVQPSGPRLPAALPTAYHRTPSVDRLVARQLKRNGAVDVLVSFDGASTLAGAHAAARGSSLALLRDTEPAYRTLKAGVHLRVPGLEVLQDYQALPVQFVHIDSRQELSQLENDPAVIGIGADRVDRLDLTQSLPLIGQPEAAAAGHTGAGTAVAVLDSGVDYTRPAFGSCPTPGASGCKVVIAQDFAPDDGLRDDPAAGFHGTNVSGIVVGVAPDTKVLGLDVFNGLTSTVATQVAAINFVVSQQATYNIRAINMSLGNASFNTAPCSDPSDARVAAFANARAAGILPVIAAGNGRSSGGSDHAGVARPACIPGAVPVGAVYDSDVGSKSYSSGCSDPTTAADQITCFSQVWADPMLMAPGAVISAAGVAQSGTSQAAPHVAGATAVLFGAADDPSVSEVERALLDSGPSIVDPLVGESFHRLDVPAAVSALGVTISTPPPTTTVTPPPSACTIEGTDEADVLVGTPGDDVICGAGGGDVLISNGGTDVIDGGGGFDFVSLEGASGGGSIDLNTGIAIAPGTSATLQKIEGGMGTGFNDTLLGNGVHNEFLGQGGDDVIEGGGGFDFIRYDFATVRIRVNFDTGRAQGEGTDTFTGVEGFVGSPMSDKVIGDSKPNTLIGQGGGDRLAGLGHPDRLVGGAGADGLFGGGGIDQLLGGPGKDICDSGAEGGSMSSC